MEFIHGFLNWREGTKHSSSFQQEKEAEEEEEEEELKRNWLELPPDVMSLILLKLGAVTILANAQWVCTSWWKLSRQPHLFRSIYVDQFSLLFGHSINGSTLLTKLVREAIDRSCGQLDELSVKSIGIDNLLQYMPEKSYSLRCLRLVSCPRVYDYSLLQIAEKVPQLEELEMIRFAVSKNVIETVACLCPQLKSCRLSYVNCGEGYEFHEVPLAIAENMPNLRNLNLSGNGFLMDYDLIAVLDGCKHLESLDLRKCHGLRFTGDLKERCENIKVLRLPNDPMTDDFGNEHRFFDHSYSNYDVEDEIDEYFANNY